MARPPRILGWPVADTAALLATAFAVIASTHVCRGLYGELQSLEAQRWYLEEEYSRLLLEQSTWASHHRIEREAAEDARPRRRIPARDPAGGAMSRRDTQGNVPLARLALVWSSLLVLMFLLCWRVLSCRCWTRTAAPSSSSTRARCAWCAPRSCRPIAA
jgi:cell division protein FtsL